ncbi:MAG: preprotein translocase subunit SecE [Magnetococcales bacterium]|nr:preprotein translocase subunit SecE [Magnetococcales bacterium]
MERLAQFRQYLTDVQLEMKKVVWPTRKETTNTTLVVVVMVIVVSIFLWIVDTLLALAVHYIIA